MSQRETDLTFLRRCVELAGEALVAGDEPFGSLLVDAAGEVRFEDRNRVQDGDETRHPELEVARWSASHLTADERAASTVYTSGEHCPMCSAAHAWMGLGPIVYAASSAQLVAWRHGWGLSPSPVLPLAIHEVAPGRRGPWALCRAGGRAPRDAPAPGPALLRLVAGVAAESVGIGHAAVHQVGDQALGRVLEVVAVVHPDARVVGDERDLDGLVVLGARQRQQHVERALEAVEAHHQGVLRALALSSLPGLEIRSGSLWRFGACGVSDVAAQASAMLVSISLIGGKPVNHYSEITLDSGG